MATKAVTMSIQFVVNEYLLGSPEMKTRLLESLGRTGGESWDEVRDALGM